MLAEKNRILVENVEKNRTMGSGALKKRIVGLRLDLRQGRSELSALPAM